MSGTGLGFVGCDEALGDEECEFEVGGGHGDVLDFELGEEAGVEEVVST